MRETKILLFQHWGLTTENNRGIYHAISAVHALDGNAYKRHKDALANFNKNYVKTEIFPRKLGKKIVESEEIRHASDYDDFYIATREEAEEQIQTAKELVSRVEEYVQARWVELGGSDHRKYDHRK